MATTVPTVNPITATPPERSQGQDEFNSNAADYLVQQKTFSTEVNAMITPLNTAVGEAETAATNAETSAANAQTAADASAGTANYQGEWSVATGPASVGESYSDLGVIWVVKQAIADITLSQPSDGADWQRVSSQPAGSVEVEAGENIPAGRAVYLSKDGKAYGLTDNDPTTYRQVGRFGDPENINSNDNAVVCETNGSGTFLIAYLDDATSDHYVVAAQLSDTEELTFGTPVVYEVSGVISPDIVYDSANDVFVIVYADNGDNDYLQYCVVSVSGTVLTVNASAQIGTNEAVVSRAQQVIAAVYEPNAGSIVVAWEGASAENTKAIAGQVSGTTITWGSTVDSGLDAGTNLAIAANAGGDITVHFLTSTTARLWPITVSGTTLSAAAVVSTTTCDSTSPVEMCYHVPSNAFITFAIQGSRVIVNAYVQSGLSYTAEYDNTSRQITNGAYLASATTMRVYADPNSHAVLMHVGDADEPPYEYKISISENLDISVSYEMQVFNITHKTNARPFGKGCVFSKGRMMLPDIAGRLFIKNFTDAIYNYGWTDHIAVPFTVASTSYINFALNDDGTQILVATGNRLIAGTIDTATKAITWGSEFNPSIITDEKVALLYHEETGYYIYATQGNGTANINIQLISVSGNTCSLFGSNTTFGTNATSSSDIALGYNKAKGIVTLAYERVTSLNLVINNFSINALGTKSSFGEVEKSATVNRIDRFIYHDYTKTLYLGYIDSGTARLDRIVYDTNGSPDSTPTTAISSLGSTSYLAFDSGNKTEIFIDYDTNFQIRDFANSLGLSNTLRSNDNDSVLGDLEERRILIHEQNDDSFYKFWYAPSNDTWMGAKLKRVIHSNQEWKIVDPSIAGIPHTTIFDYVKHPVLGPMMVYDHLLPTATGTNEHTICFFQTGEMNIDRFLGINQLTVTSGNNAVITTKGAKSSSVTGLTVGDQYINGAGLINDQKTIFNKKVGTAVSATDLVLDN